MEKQHTKLNGLDLVTDPKVLALIDRVIDKIVRIKVSDGRVYVGMLKSIDQTKSVFV